MRESGLVKGTGRGKKVYGITNAGRERLVELLADPDVSDDRAFTLRVAFARHLPSPVRLEVFERRRTEVLGRRDDLRRRRTGRRADPYLGALLERDADHLANDLAWLDRPDRDRAQPIQAIHGGNVMTGIRLAIAGVGNCASSLVQGIEFYKDADPTERVPGLMHVVLGGYHIRDIELVAAFDVDAEKVGLDASKALLADINNTIKFAEVPHLGVGAARARPSTASASSTARSPRRARPSPSTWPRCCATRRPTCSCRTSRSAPRTRRSYYAQACLDAGVAFVNAIPVFIASDPEWAEKFTEPPASRSSATTSRARSAPPSCTARWPASSRTAAPRSTTRTS